MVDTYYTADQVDQQAVYVAGQINDAVEPEGLATRIAAVSGRNFLTDAEKTKLAGLEGSRFLGTFTGVSAIPIVAAGPGSYADVDAGGGATVQRAIYDVDAGEFVLSTGVSTAETAASVKSKYEDNPDTNAFTDDRLAKLADLNPASGIGDFTLALTSASGIEGGGGGETSLITAADTADAITALDGGS